VEEKKLLSPLFNPREILQIATFKERCIHSGEHFLKGLYPLESHKFNEQIWHHKEENSPIKNTMYERALTLIEDAFSICLAGPVIDIDHISDLMLHTRNCRTLHKYLNQD
jgi:hypothetical protein